MLSGDIPTFLLWQLRTLVKQNKIQQPQARKDDTTTVLSALLKQLSFYIFTWGEHLKRPGRILSLGLSGCHTHNMQKRRARTKQTMYMIFLQKTQVWFDNKLLIIIFRHLRLVITLDDQNYPKTILDIHYPEQTQQRIHQCHKPFFFLRVPSPSFQKCARSCASYHC